MPADFVPKTVTKTAKRDFTNVPATVEAWRVGIDAFIADTTMGLAQKIVNQEYYKIPVKYTDEFGKEQGVITVKVSTPTAYDAVSHSLDADQDLSDTIAGSGSRADMDESESAWVIRFSCILYDANYKKDTFSITFYRKYAVVSGYEKDETLAVIETWFDNNAVFA